MIAKIEAAIRRYKLLDGVNEVTVALSGGADSVSLLFALNMLKNKYGFSLYAAHFHHGIRGKEADRDLAFCEELCRKLSVALFSEKGNVPLYSKEKGISLETGARELRYDFLNRVSKGVIATAHTASDNAETILFNLSRGSSATGIRGIPPKRCNIIRPLIFCGRTDVENFLRKNGLQFVTDSTNLTDDCSRNIIRHKVIPVLKEINSSLEDNCSKLSVCLGEDNDFICSIAEKEYLKRYDETGLDIRSFNILHPAVAKRVIIRYYNYIIKQAPDFYHIEKIYDICLKGFGTTSAQTELFATINRQRLIFTEGLEVPDLTFKVEIKNLNRDEFKALSLDKNIPKGKINKLFLKSAVDCDKIIGNPRMIKKNSGDTLKLANSNCTKTLKKLITEKKIPLEQRKNIPVFADDEGIVWVYGVGCADRVKIDDKTNRIILFDISIGEK